MNQKFFLHLDNTGQPGGSISSIHMNRAQAARVIKQNIINNCRSHLGRPYNVTPFIDKASNIVGHKIPYYLANDISFVEFLRLSGAHYWFREYDRYMKNGKELQPSKDDGILRSSVVLVSALNDTDYCVLSDEKFSIPSAAILKENERIINELNDSHYILDKLVDGYMFAQRQEKLIEMFYRLNPNLAELNLELLNQEYGWI